ncbi:GvpL/GvpF family gas vesicle protein [Streptomyces sp. NPDC047002]|uniref:GvpL/GvpF family gas vesicle protein n=1 Tax=Streptomyces sp. NPDC047002 TaxID=3155475 RepID=UPI0034514F0F
MTAQHAAHGPVAGTVSYLYAVCRADVAAAPPVAGVPAGPGDGPAPLRLVREGTLAAVVSSVPADAYSTEGLEASLGDLERLEALARAHNAVVDAVHARATVLPMRLATVYLDDARVAEVLREGAEDFGRLLDRLEGHDELGVKVYATPADRARGAAPREEPPAPEGSSPGRAYLRRRQAQRRSHRDAHRAAGEAAARLPEAVAELARGRAVHRPQQADAAKGAGENIANEAYLVARSDRTAFRAAVAALADGVPGVRVEVTGPWAPYSFTSPGAGQEAGTA